MIKQFSLRSESNTAVLEADEACETVDGPLVKVDRGAQDQKASHAQCGYGACSISGCYCQSYSGSAYTCANCGHNYASHW